MDSEFRKDANGHRIAPLPFRTPKPAMPNNREKAMERDTSLYLSLQRDPNKRTHFVTFMEKVISSGAAEEAPPPVENREYWYLPSLVSIIRGNRGRSEVYCKRGSFRVGVIFAFFALLYSSENYPHAKLKPICLYEGNMSSIVKITPT